MPKRLVRMNHEDPTFEPKKIKTENLITIQLKYIQLFSQVYVHAS